MAFQSTLPARGATIFACRNSVKILYFNPRSPHGERHRRARTPALAPCISIHAPRTGSDRLAICLTPSAPHFNPRSPHGERLEPQRGFHHVLLISIHAPRTGSDLPPMQTCGISRIFQSTLPARGATEAQRPCCARADISIHAPRTGSDPIAILFSGGQEDFNPRSPHGERLGGVIRCSIYSDFNPRSPHGERHSRSSLRRPQS